MIKSLLLAVGLLSAGTAFADSFSNGSFESSSVSAGSYAYAPVSAPWTFSASGAGVASTNSAWGGVALDGNKYAFLQGVSSIAQTFSGAAGQYLITFSLAERTNEGAVGSQKINAFFDGQQLSLAGQNQSFIRPPVIGNDDDNYGGWSSYTFIANSAISGQHTLSFAGLVNTDKTGRNIDTTVFLDNVSVSAPVPEPETYAMLLAGLGLMGAIARRRKSNQA